MDNALAAFRMYHAKINKIGKLGSRKLNPITPRQELNRLAKAESAWFMDVLMLHVMRRHTAQKAVCGKDAQIKRSCAACRSSVAVARGYVVAFLAARLRASNVCPGSNCRL